MHVEQCDYNIVQLAYVIQIMWKRTLICKIKFSLKIVRVMGSSCDMESDIVVFCVTCSRQQLDKRFWSTTITPPRYCLQCVRWHTHISSKGLTCFKLVFLLAFCLKGNYSRLLQAHKGPALSCVHFLTFNIYTIATPGATGFYFIQTSLHWPMAVAKSFETLKSNIQSCPLCQLTPREILT